MFLYIYIYIYIQLISFHIGPTGIEEELKNKLNENKIKKGDDLIIMVVNEGEILFIYNKYVYVCMYVCIYVCVCVFVLVCIYTYKYMYLYIYKYILKKAMI
jgi:hypothetical protein